AGPPDVRAYTHAPPTRLAARERCIGPRCEERPWALHGAGSGDVAREARVPGDLDFVGDLAHAVAIRGQPPAQTRPRESARDQTGVILRAQIGRRYPIILDSKHIVLPRFGRSTARMRRIHEAAQSRPYRQGKRSRSLPQKIENYAY